LIWRYRASFISPVWQLDVPQWPPDPGGGAVATPILRSWWLDAERKLPPAAVLKVDGGDFPRTLRIDDSTSLVVESIAIEPHLVEVEPEQSAEKTCLVVRLAFPRGSPFLIEPGQLSGLESDIVGHEHRFYTAAGKYTGLFWPVNRAQLEKLKSLGVTSLVQLLDQAEKRKTATSIKPPIPQRGRLPQPPVALRN
jgi:hypothetical protein